MKGSITKFQIRITRDTDIAVLFSLLSLAFACGAVVQHLRVAQTEESALKGGVAATSSNRLLAGRGDFRGSAECSYTLVEFADYQCPPCRQANEELPGVLRSFGGRLRFDYRNFPLTALHANAMSAALAAESARAQGRFWPIHDALMTTELDLPPSLIKPVLSQLVVQEHLDPASFWRYYNNTAPAVVAADIQLGKSLGIGGTPTFLLCCPDHRVIRLPSLEQVKYWMR
jgi:protein-disulfide isomerase